MSDRIEKRIELRAPVARVWRALTDHREFGAWFRARLDGPFVAGEATRGQVSYPGYEHVRWQATVQKMEPDRLCSFTWHPYAVDASVDYSTEPPTLVEFRLEPTPNGTLLTVTESGFDHLPAHRRAEALPMTDGGRTMQLNNIARHVGWPAAGRGRAPRAGKRVRRPGGGDAAVTGCEAVRRRAPVDHRAREGVAADPPGDYQAPADARKSRPRPQLPRGAGAAVRVQARAVGGRADVSRQHRGAMGPDTGPAAAVRRGLAR
jgi:uncharacterized protein YndB with AHSA1/START domain